MPASACRRFRSFAPLALAAALAACGGTPDDDRARDRLDAQLTNATVDPAVRAAIESPIATDPDLTGDAERSAIKPADRPLTGALPARLALPDPRAQALKLAGGTLIHAPAATREVTTTRDPATLGARAVRQGGARCPEPAIRYGAGWAGRLPAAFPLYPGAAVTEAAGANGAPCALRAVRFLTPAETGAVLDFYATMARRGGYSIAHTEENDADILAGARKGGDSYSVRVRAAPGGGSSVDLIVHGDPADGR